MSSNSQHQIIYYDIETTSKWASYCNLKMIGVAINDEPPRILVTLEEHKKLRKILASPDWIKVNFNGTNFDDIVLARHGYPVNYENRHDLFLMAKTVCPLLPAYGLKFINWYFFNDPHEPERRLHAWMQHHGIEDMYKAPYELLEPYCLHDVTQTRRLWKMFWPIVQRERHWRAYHDLELPFGAVLHEIMLRGGDCVNIQDIKTQIKKLETQIQRYNQEAKKLTDGKITNVNSSKQCAQYLKKIEGIELEYSDKGNLVLQKDDLLTLLDLDNPQNDQSKLARIAYETRNTYKQLAYLRAYHRAALYELRSCDSRKLYRQRSYCCIPKSYSLSGARTRRILSSSQWGINFQNPNKTAKKIQLVPAGWLGCWIDETQIENIVHIWASNDIERRKAYEADQDWNEYVWLCNQILGGNRTREELDKIPSDVNPMWSVYKQYKTSKLGINFGLGIASFCEKNHLDYTKGESTYNRVHKACPAIKGLQRKVRHLLSKQGYIEDPFGHIYSGSPHVAYKVVAYLIQGCGTGSFPKAMGRALYNTLHQLPPLPPIKFDSMSNEHGQSGIMCGTTHDEFSFRISLKLPTKLIINTLAKCLYDCEERFSPILNNIPLRAKLSLSITNAAEAIEINHHKLGWKEWAKQIREFIIKGRKRMNECQPSSV
jgi:hypothetical protein